MTKHLYSMANALLKGDQGQVDAAFKEAVHDKMRTRLELARKDVAERRFRVVENEDHKSMLAKKAAEEDHKSGKTRPIGDKATKEIYDSKRAALKRHDETKPKD